MEAAFRSDCCRSNRGREEHTNSCRNPTIEELLDSEIEVLRTKVRDFDAFGLYITQAQRHIQDVENISDIGIIHEYDITDPNEESKPRIVRWE